MVMKEKKVKISFLGDIMCEKPFLDAAKKRDGSYEFSTAFKGMKEICSQSDYVVANLETPFAGKDKGYTNEFYLFNTPDSFAKAVKEMGISVVTTANNHCCDRGLDGVRRTIDILDEYKIPHVGTYKSSDEDRIFCCTVGGIKIALISCTSSTNPLRNKCKVTRDNVNLIQKQKTNISLIGNKRKLGTIKDFIIREVIGDKLYINARKSIGLSPKKIQVDNVIYSDRLESEIENIIYQIKKAKEKADFVFVCPHMGGQFNLKPGKFSEYIMNRLVEAGANAVIASHPHIVQKFEMKNGIPCAFSLGNVSMSLSTMYILRENMPEYGIMLHLYLTPNYIEKVTFSVIKIDEVSGYLYINPVSSLYETITADKQEKMKHDVQLIVNRVKKQEIAMGFEIKDEYELYSLQV